MFAPRGNGTVRRAMTERQVRIEADDGVQLAGSLFLPDGDGPFAALLEALPYRKDDVTSSYRESYARYVDAGFAVLRLDLRGTGSSAGVMTDEYPDVERGDLRRTIEWLATQPWSTGRVGMFGTSYSGFNSLQMAAEGGVPALGAVVAMYATDDRYTDDVHWSGGVLRAIDLIDYPLYMVAMNALPPVPAIAGEGWRDEWRQRVEATPPWLLEWLTHPARRPDVAPRLDSVGSRRRRLRADGVSDDAHRRMGRRLPQQHVPHDRAVRAQSASLADDRRTLVAPQPRTRSPGPQRRRHPRGGGLLRRTPPRWPTVGAEQGAGLRPPFGRTATGSGDTPRRLARPRHVATARARTAGVVTGIRRRRSAGRSWRCRGRRLELVRRGTALGPAPRPTGRQRQIVAVRLADRRRP